MNLGIANRVALITGAGRNIGRAIALALGREGARCVLVGRSREHLAEVLKSMPCGPGQHLAIPLDLECQDAPERLNELIPPEFGRPEIIVHNLGGSLGVTDAVAPTTEWARVWRFNVGIAHGLNRLFLPDMVRRRWGRIVHLSTQATQSHDGYPAYVSAKCALDGYVRSMSRQVSRHNVVMNALAPGLIDIEGRYFNKLRVENSDLLDQYFDHHLPIRRMGSAGEMAEIVAFLCSEHAAFMPGSIVRADGGGG